MSTSEWAERPIAPVLDRRDASGMAIAQWVLLAWGFAPVVAMLIALALVPLLEDAEDERELVASQRTR